MVVRCGTAPFLECSSKGDKRFSAFYARIKGRGNRSVEEIYQAAKVFENGETGLDWKAAKGRKAVNWEEVTNLYATLWDEYIMENPGLLPVLIDATGLSDIFGQPNNNCQSVELWRIRCNALGISPFMNKTIIADKLLSNKNQKTFDDSVAAALAPLRKAMGDGEICMAGADEPYREGTLAEYEQARQMRQKAYVCGFVFSQDFKQVWLIRKNRPKWQAGRLNGIGGGVDAGESPLAAMVRECREECTVETEEKDWAVLEQFNHSNGVQVTFFACRLKFGQQTPVTNTDEVVEVHDWYKYSLADWTQIDTIDNIAYLVYKGYSFFQVPEAARMELQNAQDSRSV